MLLANKHLNTLAIGIDIHINTLPPFNPIHPYIGLVIDLGDYIPFFGAKVHVNKLKRGVGDTSGMLVFFKHIPLFTGPFAMIPMIGHESANFFGSVKTAADGSKFSPAGYMMMTCNDVGIPLSLKPGKKFIPIPTLFAPTSFSIPIPAGSPVMVGGPYAPDFGSVLKNMIMGYTFGAIFKIAGKVAAKAQKALDKKTKMLMSANIDKMAGTWEGKLQKGKSGYLKQPRMSRAEIQAFKQDMKEIGVEVEFDKKRILPPDVRGAFDASKGKIYLKKGATKFEAFHEGSHAKQWSELGKQKYLKQNRLQRETHVYEKIKENEKSFVDIELNDAKRYLNDVREKFGELPIN